MSSLTPAPVLARPEDHRAGWCPACHKLRPATLSSGTTDWQVEPVFTCNSCGTIIREMLVSVTAQGTAPIEVAALPS